MLFKIMKLLMLETQPKLIDGKAILNKLNPKATWVKQGADLAVSFNISIDTHTHDLTAVIVTSDCYRDISLKQATRTSKQGKRLRMHFILGYIDKEAILRKWQCPSYSLLKKLNNQFVVTLQRRLNFFCENDKFDILYQRIVRRSFLMAKKYLITMKKQRR